MRRNSIMHKFILFSVAAVCIFAVQYFLTLQPVRAAELYERKSISFVNYVLSTSSASQMPKDKVTELEMEVKKKIKEIPRFDYNDLPETFLEQFREKSREYVSKTLRNIDSLNASIKQNEKSYDNVQQHIKRLDKLAQAIISNKDVISKADAKQRSQYLAEKEKYQKKRAELVRRISLLRTQREAEEYILSKRAAKLLTEVVAPVLIEVLSDPELQRIRAQELVDEVERNKFIVRKAKDLGITREDLEKVMNSAYLYMIFLTDYIRTSTRDQKTGKERVEEKVSGGMIWFKLVLSTEKPQVQVLKVIRRISGELFGFDPGVFAFGLKEKTLEIDDFKLKTSVIEVSGNKIGFPLGKKDGLCIDKKFRVYEKQKIGDRIEEKKQGFFYVDKIGDNLSYGKLVIHGAEPGMQIRELLGGGLYLNIRYRLGIMKIKQGSLQTPPYGLNINKDVDIPIHTLDFVIRWDIGRFTRIPQSFVTIGLDATVDDSPYESTNDIIITTEPYYQLELRTLHYDSLYVGFLKKWYILNRTAFYIEPLVQYHGVSMSFSSDDKRIGFFRDGLSFSADMGMELAVREYIYVGISLSSKLLTANFDITTSGAEITYPKVFLGGYLSLDVFDVARFLSNLVDRLQNLVDQFFELAEP